MNNFEKKLHKALFENTAQCEGCGRTYNTSAGACEHCGLEPEIKKQRFMPANGQMIPAKPYSKVLRPNGPKDKKPGEGRVIKGKAVKRWFPEMF